MTAQGSISFVVGEEKKLTDVLSESDVLPLLKSVVGAGLDLAAIVDMTGEPLWFFVPGETAPGAMLPLGTALECRPIILSGDIVGRVHLSAGEGIDPALLRFLARVVGDAVNSMVQTNLKRMMVTELHTKVVQMSYDELLEKNRQLSASEQKYRELAEHLEMRVQERTAELKQAYARMLQQEKMASVGQLAAGMAHEINNPLSFVLSNLETLEKYVRRLSEHAGFCEGQLRQSGSDDLAGRVEDRRREQKIDFILDDLSDLFSQSLAGAERVKKIVSDLRGFSHIDEAEYSQLDVNIEIDRTLSVLSSEIPADAEITREFGAIPLIVCRGALLCQAFLNIIRNALQAKPSGLKLLIRTAMNSKDHITVVFKDNGPGIAQDIQARIFEPFFTTHEVGSGMGMGLKVVYDAVSSCGGTVTVNSREDHGAVFVITLPVNGRTDE